MIWVDVQITGKLCFEKLEKNNNRKWLYDYARKSNKNLEHKSYTECVTHDNYYSPPPPPQKKKNQIRILCQNSLTRELKIRVVGFVLKKLLIYLEMLIVPHALQCVGGCFFVFYRI